MDENHDKNERELFEEKTAKQLKTTKKTLLITFTALGAFLMFLGVILYLLGIDKADGYIGTFVLLGLGAFYIILGIILNKALPDKINYDKYKFRISKEGGVDVYSLSWENAKLKEKVDALEKRVEELESRINGRY